MKKYEMILIYHKLSKIYEVEFRENGRFLEQIFFDNYRDFRKCSKEKYGLEVLKSSEIKFRDYIETKVGYMIIKK